MLSRPSCWFVLLMTTSWAFAVDPRIANVVDARHFDESTYPIAVPPGPAGTTYYISPTGNDANNGRSPATPWKTMAHAMWTGTRYYGDTILMMAGTYRANPAEYFYIPSLSGTGSASNLFTIGAYGDGEVIIDWSEAVTWTLYTGNIYQAALGSGVNADSIVMDDNFRSCRPKTSPQVLTSDGYWYQSGTTVYLCVTSGTPTSRNAKVRRADWDNTVYGVNAAYHNWVRIAGLTFLHAPSYAVTFYGGSHNSIVNCKFKYSGKAAWFPGSYTTVQKCFLQANIMMMWPRGRSWATGGWPNNNIGPVGGLAEGNIVLDNGGEGLGVCCNSGGGGSVVQDNIIVDAFSVSIYPDSTPNYEIRRNYIYSGPYVDSDIADPANNDPIAAGGSKASVARKTKAFGIMLGDEVYGGGGSHHQRVYDNIIVGSRKGINTYFEAPNSGFINGAIYNNTVILPADDSATYGDGFFVGIDMPGGNHSNSVMANNMVIGNNASSYLVRRDSGAGVTVNNNVYHHPNNAAAFRFGTNAFDFSGWKTASGQDAASVQASPQLNRTDWSNPASVALTDLYLTAGSPARAAGLNPSPILSNDYNGAVFPDFDAGALAFATYAFTPDADGDRMSDAYEARYWTNATAGNAQADDDGDGFSNLDEELADTVPNGAAGPTSTLEIQRIEDQAGDWSVRFVGSTGRLYTLQFKNDLLDGATSWSNVAAETRGSGASMTLGCPAGTTQRMYRLQVRKP